MAYLDKLGLLTGWRNTAGSQGLTVPGDRDLQLVSAASDDAWPAEVSDLATRVWRETIEFLLHQQAAGIHNPIATLPSRLAFPPGSRPDERPVTGARADRAPDGWTPTGNTGQPGASAPTDYKNVSYGPPSWYTPPEVDEPVEVAPSAERTPPSPAPTGGPATDSKEAALLDWKRSEERKGTRGVDRIKDNDLINIARHPPATIDALRVRLSNDATPLAEAIADVLGIGGASPAAPPESAARPTAWPSAGGFAAQFATPVPNPTASGPLTGEPAPPPDSTSSPVPAGSSTAGTVTPPTVSAGLVLERFSPYDLNQFDFDLTPPMDLKVAVGNEGARRLSWPPAGTPHPVVLYRLVSADDGPPVHVDAGDLVMAGTELETVDVRAPLSGARYYQVWVNVGPTVEQAQRSQPRLHAESAVVSQLLDVKIRPEGNAVVGNWQYWDEFEPRTTSVQLYRIPAAAARMGNLHPQFRIHAEQDLLTGFVDAEAEPGRSYVYAVVAVAQIDSSTEIGDDGLPLKVTKTSTPTRALVHVPAPLHPVTDLEVELHDDLQNPCFDVLWTPPSAGTVKIFRTASGPAAGFQQQGIMDAARLPAGNLIDDAELNRPTYRLPDGRVAMQSVPWPADADRIFFTPVTVLQGRAVLGGTKPQVRVPPVVGIKLVERVDEEVLHFPWPRGASHVHAYVGHGNNDDPGQDTWQQEISRTDWERQGGMHIRPPLPPRGCQVHLYSAAYSDRRKIYGAPASVPYGPLLRLYCDVIIKKNLVQQPVTARITIRALERTTHQLSFSVIHNEHRLPLEIRDGVPMFVSRVEDETTQWVAQMTVGNLSPESVHEQWQVNLRPAGQKLTGYIRVFAQLEVEQLNRIALMDPPVRRLMIG